MKITAIRATPVTIPMDIPFFWSVGLYPGTSKTIIEVETDEGIVGLGESPSWDCAEVINKNVSSDIPVGTPKILWLASRKPMAKTIIPELEVGNGHPLAVGLHLRQHGLKVCVKAEARSDSPEGLGLDTRFGHAIVF